MRKKAQRLKRETVVDKYTKRATCIKFKAVIDFQENRRY